MIFIIEGPDGAGKTTLANKFTGYPIKHFKAPEDPIEEAKMFSVYWELLRTHNNIVIDRAWPSEKVYGPIFREHTFITDEMQLKLEYAFKEKIMYIYCTGDPAVMWNRAKERGETFVPDFETYERICKAYDIEMSPNFHIVPILKYEVFSEETL